MKTKLLGLGRSAYGAIALALAAAGLLPMFMNSAMAASQVTNRQIQMSSSKTSDTGVTYNVTFTPATTETHPDVIVDFCSNDPIIGDSCTATVGTDVPDFTSSAATGWTVTQVGGSTWRGVKLTTTTVSFTSGTPVTITITGVKNPSNTGTFYGRILDYATGGAGTNTSASPGTYVDYGGIALSTAALINVTAKVQEQLSFCVYTTGGCGTNNGVTLGNTQGVLSTTLPSVDKNTFFDVQTNAQGKAVVNVKGNTLTSGANTIAALSTAHVYTAGSSQFGLCDYESAGSTLDVSTNVYNGNNGSAPGTLCSGTTQGQASGNDHAALFYLGSNATSGTYGDTIATDSSGGTATGNVVFMGSTSTSQTAGIYTTSMMFIATGTF